MSCTPYRQRARRRAVEKRHARVNRHGEVRARPGEQLRDRINLGMDLESDNGFPIFPANNGRT